MTWRAGGRRRAAEAELRPAHARRAERDPGQVADGVHRDLRVVGARLDAQVAAADAAGSSSSPGKAGRSPAPPAGGRRGRSGRGPRSVNRHGPKPKVMVSPAAARPSASPVSSGGACVAPSGDRPVADRVPAVIRARGRRPVLQQRDQLRPVDAVGDVEGGEVQPVLRRRWRCRPGARRGRGRRGPRARSRARRAPPTAPPAATPRRPRRRSAPSRAPSSRPRGPPRRGASSSGSSVRLAVRPVTTAATVAVSLRQRLGDGVHGVGQRLHLRRREARVGREAAARPCRGGAARVERGEPRVQRRHERGVLRPPRPARRPCTARSAPSTLARKSERSVWE